MKKAVLIIGMVFLLSNSVKADSSFVSFSIGNKYAFSGYRHIHGFIYDDTISFIDKIVADTIIQGKHYFVFNRTNWKNKSIWPREDTLSISYRRSDSVSIFEYNTLTTLEDTLVRTHDSIGTKYYSSGYALVDTIQKMYFGKQVQSFGVGPFPGIQHVLAKRYAQQFFLIDYFIFGLVETSVRLMAAQVNGVVYGNSSLLSVERQCSSTVPENIILQQNYPNPFNPTTIIRFSLHQKGVISLKVFDLLGRETAVLIDGVIDAGYHSIIFNGANSASGVYIYRLQSGGHVTSKKFVLVK